MTWEEHLDAVAALIEELQHRDDVDWSTTELPPRPSVPLSLDHAARAQVVAARLDELIERLETEQGRVTSELTAATRFQAGGDAEASIVDALG